MFSGPCTDQAAMHEQAVTSIHRVAVMIWSCMTAVLWHALVFFSQHNSSFASYWSVFPVSAAGHSQNARLLFVSWV